MRTLNDVEAAVAAIETATDSEGRASDAAELSRWIRQRCWQTHARGRAASLAARCDAIAGGRLPRFTGVCSGGIWHAPVM